MYIYSRPGVDRISDMFKTDFEKNKKIVGIFSKPSVFTRFRPCQSRFLPT